MATILPCTPIAAEELALALEISQAEGLPMREALTLARAELRDVLAYAARWDAQAQAATPQPVGAA
jgi:hypothetical protein